MVKAAITAAMLVMVAASPVLADSRAVQGRAGVANGAADATMIAAQGAGKVVRLQYAVCSVEVAAVGGGGEVAIEDGLNGTRIWQADADAVGSYSLNFGHNGYALTANTLLNLTVDGAATTQATASCAVTGVVND